MYYWQVCDQEKDMLMIMTLEVLEHYDELELLCMGTTWYFEFG